MGGVLLVWALHNGFLLPWEMQNVDAEVLEPALIAARAVIWLVPIALYLRRHDPRRALVALGMTTRLNWRGLAWSALVAAAHLALITLVVRATTPPPDDAALAKTLAPLHIVYVASKAALEEIQLRGFLLGQLLRYMSSRRAQVCVAVLFMLMHWPSRLALDGFGIELLPLTIFTLLLGTVLGIVARASNNVIPAIGLHFANNLLGELLGGS